ncbi:MAG: hypothetical protein EXS63_08065, partial [Candidatus Omnitrophica bacterium]|nr:hypothetical protein [Candidatus Omnitrophota bacterium]
MIQSYKETFAYRSLALFTALALAFAPVAFACDDELDPTPCVANNTTIQVLTNSHTTLTEALNVGKRDTLRIEVLDALGDVCPTCAATIQTSSITNNGTIDTVGFLALIANTIINNGAINVTGDLLLANAGIDKAAFLAGVAELARNPNAAPGSILNTGQINNLTKGIIALLGSEGGVHNFGTIISDGGAVALVAGNEISMPLTMDGLISINIEKGAEISAP